MINPQWLKLPMARTHFHDPKDDRVIEDRLYFIYVNRIYLTAFSRRLYIVRRIEILGYPLKYREIFIIQEWSPANKSHLPINGQFSDLSAYI